MKSIEEYRVEFPITGHGVFLNHAGVSPISGRAAGAVVEWIEENNRGVSARYETWSRRIEEVRTKAARLLGASPEEIAFVKSTSHGLNHVAQGIAWKKGDNIISYEREFPANYYPWKNLESRGVELRLVGDREGRISVKDIEAAADSNTRLVSISSVEFLTGFRNDLEAIGGMCGDRGILFCVDAIQSLGALDIDVNKCRIDFLAADSHKWLLGPEGIGVFFVRRDKLDLLSLQYVGWHSVKDPLQFLPYHFELKNDASRFEEGSHNLAGIFALGGSLSIMEEVGIKRIESRIIELTDRLVDGLKDLGMKIISPRGPAEKSGIVTFTGPDEPAEIVAKLADKNIYICSRQGALRVSPHFYNSMGEIDKFLAELSTLKE